MLPITPYIREGVLVFTITSNGYKYFTLNLLETIKRAGITWKMCIVCTDKASHTFFRGQNVSSIMAPTIVPDMGPDISSFGTTNFQKLNRAKLDLLAALAQTQEVQYGIYMDGDITVYNDFVPDILERLKGGPAIHLQCDEANRLPCSGPLCPNACTGFIAWSHGISPEIFQVNLKTLALWRQCPQDQVFINARMHELGVPFQSLPRDLYPNGHFLRLYGADSTLKTTTNILHYNYTVGMDKQRRMRQNGDWLTIL